MCDVVLRTGTLRINDSANRGVRKPVVYRIYYVEVAAILTAADTAEHGAISSLHPYPSAV